LLLFFGVSGVGVPGNKELLYVRGPVLCGLVEIGGNGAIRFGGSLFSPLGTCLIVDSVGCCAPFIDTTEVLSIDTLGTPLRGVGGLLPFSVTPLTPPLIDSPLSLRNDLFS
jgi:hypothetical protein